MFTLEYADGLYIAKDGEGVIDLAEPENLAFAEFVVKALNAARLVERRPKVKKAGGAKVVKLKPICRASH